MLARPQRALHDGRAARSVLARSLDALGFPAPSKDGEFLQIHTVSSLIARMGEPRDDSENTFTARMLMLLESRPLLGDDVYERVLERVLDAYWKNTEGNEHEYVPMILINDIVRYWRILLLNHEWKVTEAEAKVRGNVERSLSSYKLRFSRCLMCHSAIAEMIAVHRLLTPFVLSLEDAAGYVVRTGRSNLAGCAEIRGPDTSLPPGWYFLHVARRNAGGERSYRLEVRVP
jgi:hypothetical protein